MVTRLSDDNKDGDLHAASAKILLACKKTAAANTKLVAEIAAENTINVTTIPRNVRRGLDAGSGDNDSTLMTYTDAGGTSAKQMQCARLLTVH